MISLLEVGGLCTGYGVVQVLEDVSIRVAAGEIVSLIGPNGAGKSNLVSFFRLLHEMAAGRLQVYVGNSGGADSLLHCGAKNTTQVSAQLDFVTDVGVSEYSMRLVYAAGRTLIFAEERLCAGRCDDRPNPPVSQLAPGDVESGLRKEKVEGYVIMGPDVGHQKWQLQHFRNLLEGFRTYHFHDTTQTSGIRQSCYAGNNLFLMPDASNLAAMLLLYRDRSAAAYHRIVETVRQVAPFFDDFVLARTPPDNRNVLLDWKSRESDQVFGPHQLSDGTLRAMALITLLLQPRENLPRVIVIDEPELGLHLYAMIVVASLLRAAAHHCQIILATQSPFFLDQFDAEDVVVVELEQNQSVFRRLEPGRLTEWLEEYSLGELWEKNVIGGGPV